MVTSKSISLVNNQKNFGEDDENDLNWRIVKLNEVIEKGIRLEASSFSNEGEKATYLVKNTKNSSIPLGEIALKIFYGNRFKRNYISKNNDAVGFLGSAEMLDIYPKPIKFIKKSDAENNNLINDINTLLISRSGTIGNVTMVNKTLSKYAISEHAIRIISKDYPGYLYSFLKTDTAQKIIKSKIYGAVIQQIEPEHLEEIPVPNAPNDIKFAIHCKIVESYNLRDKSNELIRKATNILIEELKLPDITEFENYDNIDTFTVKLSDLNQRFDASYHINIVKKIEEIISKYSKELINIGDSRISENIILPGRFKRTYVKKGVPFLGGSELGKVNPRIEKQLSQSIHKKQIERQLGIKEFAILTPSRGTLGRVFMPPEHFRKMAISDNIIQIISHKRIFGYLFIFLNTIYGEYLIKRQTYGGVVDAIEPRHLADIKIPILNNTAIQKEINDLAIEANRLRYEAYSLEKEAIKKFNIEVLDINIKED